MAQATADELKKNDGNTEENKKPMDASLLANLKQLKIQSGALNRYTKELQSYMEELQQLKRELDDMRNKSNDDEKQDKSKKVEIKQQRQAIEETEHVIRDIRPKLVQTWEIVDGLINEFDGYVVEDEEDKELFKKTKLYLEAAEPLVND
eukprot:UN06005